MPVLVSPGQTEPEIAVKICGLTQPDDALVCHQAGARYIGLNFFPKSPRYVTPQQAREIALATPIGLAKVGLVVNPSTAEIDALLDAVPLDMVQLHGSEPPERVAELRTRIGLPIIKAIGIRTAQDLTAIDAYAPVVDQLLIDAKPPKDAVLPGGNGVPFDWTLLGGTDIPVPWMLAGGLTLDNVARAIEESGARQVDLSSGVESAPGVKDPALIHAFVAAAQA